MTKIGIVSLAVFIFFTSCIKDDYFGYSNYGEIKTIEVSNQASQAIIDSKTKNVSIEIPSGIDLSNIVIQSLTLSSFAVADKNVGDVLNLNDSALIYVVAEDGSETRWTIKAAVATENPQLTNSDFENWYQTNAGYYEPGESASTTIWGTGNQGTSLLGIYATIPLEYTAGNIVAKLETYYNGDLAAGFGTPISGGSIYTGVFNSDNLDLNNPQAAIDFGTPFSARPLAFKIKYQFNAGEENKDKEGNILPYGDGCDIYVLLEFRTGSSVKRLATAWYRNDIDNSDLEEVEIPFIYGELPADAPEYSKPENGEYVAQDSSSFINPTHITFVASSSFDANIFSGAVGSTLIVDDLELIYD